MKTILATLTKRTRKTGYRYVVTGITKGKKFQYFAPNKRTAISYAQTAKAYGDKNVRIKKIY